MILLLDAGPKKGKWALVPFQVAVLAGVAILYCITGAKAMSGFYTDMAGHAAPNGLTWW